MSSSSMWSLVRRCCILAAMSASAALSFRIQNNIIGPINHSPSSSSSSSSYRIATAAGRRSTIAATTTRGDDDEYDGLLHIASSSNRRSFLASSNAAFIIPSIVAAFASSSIVDVACAAPSPSSEGEGGGMYSPKFVQTYDDFVTMPEGWSYKDVKIASGGKNTNNDDASTLVDGDRVVFDWSGYTIGYFGRPFEAKG